MLLAEGFAGIIRFRFFFAVNRGDDRMPWKPRDFELTAEQKEAVDHDEGPILVVAGAGTGKTTVLASRIVRLIEDKLAAPNEVLAVTYTRNSARDLLKRVARIWKGSDDASTVARVVAAGLKVGTFHSYCYSLLRAATLRFDLIDDNDLYVMLRRHIEDLKLEYYTKAASPGEFLSGLNNFFNRCHDELRTPADYDAYVERIESGAISLPRVSQSKKAVDMSHEEILGRCHEIARVFHHVEDKLTAENLGTYNHVITRTIQMLRDPLQADHLEKVRQAAKFLLIDEFQDSNVAQIELARLLAGTSANIFAVGDPDQAIYRFRGATTGTFDHFLRTFGVENVKRVTMPGNRRSTGPVLKSAYLVISQNPDITSVELPGGEKWNRVPLRHERTKKEPEPVPPALVRGWVAKEEEAAFVALEIERMHALEDRAWKDFAVIYRSHRHPNEVVREFVRRGIPFAVTGLDLLETPEVRDLLSALQAMHGEDAIATLRIAALTSFAVDAEALRTKLQAQGENSNLESALESVRGGMQVVTAMQEARRLLERAGNKAVAACAIAMRQLDIRRSDDIGGFVRFVKTWSGKPEQISGNGTLSEFLEYLRYFTEAGGRVTWPEDEDETDTPASLQMEIGQAGGVVSSADTVRVLTAHAAKGLEFPVVFVLRLNTSSFPAKYHEELVEFPDDLRDPDSRLAENPKQIHSEEERRLFYVAMTRAEDALYWCAKKGTGKDVTPPGYLRVLLTAAEKSASGIVEFEIVPGIPERPPGARATEEAVSGILHWVDLPARPETLHPTLSARTIENYDLCPLKYKLSKEWNLREKPTANLHFGSAMHEALRAYFDSVQKGRPLFPEMVVQYFLQEFRARHIDDAAQFHLYERDGERQLRAFLSSEAARPHGSVARLEHWFRFDVAGNKVVGRLDRVDEDEGGYVVIDYKTGNPKSQENADDSIQLSIYALAMGGTKPLRMLVFHNIADNSVVCTQRTAEQLRETEKKIAEVAAGIASGKFEARTGMHCRWCSYRMICPEQETVVEPPVDASVPSK
jgi:DNA helicase-2/ATP-dependent DNA helicase PcrA